MPETCSSLHYSKWRHDGPNFLEAHDRWSSATAFLQEIRQQTVDITQEVFEEVVKTVNAAGRDDLGQDTVRW